MFNQDPNARPQQDTSDNFKNQLLNRIAHESRPDVKDLARLAVIDNYLKERVVFMANPRNAEEVSKWVIDASVEKTAPVFDKFGRAIDYKTFAELNTQVSTMFDGRKFVFVLEQLKPTLRTEPENPDSARQQHTPSGHSWLQRFARTIRSDFSSAQRTNSPAEYFNNTIENIVQSRLDDGIGPFWLYEAGWSLGAVCHDRENLVIITLS